MVWIDEKQYNAEEYEALSRKESEERMARHWAAVQAKERERQEGARLIRKLGAAYTECKTFLEAHPHLRPQARGDQAADQHFYEQLRQNLGHADDAPRCTHIKADGIPCRSPRMKSGMLCFAHQRMLESRPQKLRLPAMEDPNSIQLGLMQVARALIDGQISEKSAGLLFYALQTAAANVDRLTFHQAPDAMVVDEPAPPPAAEERTEARGPEPSIYEMLDQDLKLRLQEISDEFDRRRTESDRREKTASAEAADLNPELTGTNANGGKLHHGDADLQANPKLLIAADAGEHRAGPEAEGLETGFAGEGDEAGTVESRASG